MFRVFLRLVFVGTVMVSPASARSGPPDGQRVFVCGHSFHIYVAGMLETLAAEAGIMGHVNAGVMGLSDSRVIQHWNVADGKNAAKAALREARVDVLTLSPNREVPDEGIDFFADYARQFNPGTRVLVQMSWSKDIRKNPDGVFWKPMADAYLGTLRAQIQAINRRNGRDEVFIVPVAPSLLLLLDQMKSGTVPGLKESRQLFSDEICHPAAPLKNLVAFCWFGALYRQSPVGLKALDSEETPAAMNRRLQELAWQALQQEPLSGLSAELSTKE